uniref:BEN domain-containing protein 5 n=1 Tax=Leptobrachium leishanense TaxID=445787 RepID=A0A8C5R3R4_9ANUR
MPSAIVCAMLGALCHAEYPVPCYVLCAMLNAQYHDVPYWCPVSVALCQAMCPVGCCVPCASCHVPGCVPCDGCPVACCVPCAGCPVPGWCPVPVALCPLPVALCQAGCPVPVALCQAGCPVPGWVPCAGCSVPCAGCSVPGWVPCARLCALCRLPCARLGALCRLPCARLGALCRLPGVVPRLGPGAAATRCLCARLLGSGRRRILRCQGSRVLPIAERGSRAREGAPRTMFAFVRFLDDNVCFSVPADRIRGFNPRSEQDYDNRKVYTVCRGPEGEGRGGQGPTQPAQVLALAENKSDLENRVMQKRIKIPKLHLDSSDDSWAFRACEDEEESEHRRVKEPDGRRHGEAAHKSIEAVVARLEKQNSVSPRQNIGRNRGFLDSCKVTGHIDEALVPRVLYEELLRSYQQQQEEMRHIQQELERTRRQLIQQARKLKDYGTLVTEVKELRVLNRRLQDVLLLRLGSDSPWSYRANGLHDASPVATGEDHADVRGRSEDPMAIDLENEKLEYQEPDPEILKSASEANVAFFYSTPAPVHDKYILENGKVHLGSGVWVNEEKWHQLQATQGDSKYTKNLAVMIWGTDVLKNRSVTGVATKKKKDAIPKPPLSPHKLSVVRECMYDRIAQETMDENEIAQRLSKVNKYICEKIMDINKSCKNEERREAKYSLQ